MKKTAWAVIRGHSIPRGEAMFQYVGQVLEVSCIFPTRIGAETWLDHWINKKDFKVEKIELPFNVE